MFGKFITNQMQKPKPAVKETVGDLPFGQEIGYSDLLRDRTDKAPELFKALARFHEKYQSGDTAFVEAITKLGLLPHYHGCYPTERLIALTVARVINLANGIEKLRDLPFDEGMKPVEVMFGSEFVQAFTVRELVEIEF